MEFYTKADVCGNVFGIQIDLENKRFRCGFGLYHSDSVKVTKKEIHKIRQELLENGFIERI